MIRFDVTRRFQSHPWQKQMKQRERKVTNKKEKKQKKPKGKVSISKHKYFQCWYDLTLTLIYNQYLIMGIDH